MQDLQPRTPAALRRLPKRLRALESQPQRRRKRKKSRRKGTTRRSRRPSSSHLSAAAPPAAAEVAGMANTGHGSSSQTRTAMLRPRTSAPPASTAFSKKLPCDALNS